MNMNKGRVEAFSDGVFSIVMTLLIFDIKVPDLAAPVSDGALLSAIQHIAPLITIYFLSFAVLSVLWINHHFIFHSFANTVTRQLNLLNLGYLMFVAFVPFSAHLIGTYHTHPIAAAIYGANIFCIVFLARLMISYLRRHPEHMHDVSDRLIKQARFRGTLSLFCYLIGILLCYVHTSASIFFYIFPIIFNIIPGSLDLAERIFRFRLE